MQFSDISHVLASKSGKTHILQSAQSCTIHTDEIFRDEWNKAVGKGGFSDSFTTSVSAMYDELYEQFVNHLRDPQVYMSYRTNGIIFEDRHLPRKLKKAHRRGPFYCRMTKWKRQLSAVALYQQHALMGMIAKSERTPDGTAWDFTIKSETRD